MTTSTLPRTDTIDAHEARRLIVDDPSVRIIDVRSGGEFSSVHIPGAYNVPLHNLDEHASTLATLEHPVVLVCASGARARQAHTKLTTQGTPRLHVLAGGIDAWEAAGGDVVRSTTETWALDRQVRLVAGSISLAAIIASIFVPKAKWAAGAVAAGLTFSAVSNTCAMASVLSKLPYNKSDDCDVDRVVGELLNGRVP